MATFVKAFRTTSALLVPLGILLCMEARAQTIVDANSREITVFNAIPYEIAISDNVSREFTVFNSLPYETAATDAITREFTVDNVRFGILDVQRALKIAAGIEVATLADIDRLDVIGGIASTDVITVHDAVRLMRIASGLDP